MYTAVFSSSGTCRNCRVSAVAAGSYSATNRTALENGGSYYQIIVGCDAATSMRITSSSGSFFQDVNSAVADLLSHLSTGCNSERSGGELDS